MTNLRENAWTSVLLHGAVSPSDSPAGPAEVAPTSVVDVGSGAVGEGFLPSPAGWSDLLSGMDGPRYWDRAVASEQARLLRYDRVATVVLVEIAGLDATAQALGRGTTLHLFVRLAHALAGEIRTSDHIARLGRGSFAILLVETDEILAINFIDRVRARCAEELGEAAHHLRLGFGWASPPADGRLVDAEELARTRLATDLAR